MKNANQTEEVCTTQRAAEILGISVSTAQQLVEAGVIEAWKTKGGHRRIPLAAVMAYKAKPGVPAPRGDGGTTILVIEDDSMQRTLYERHISAWGLSASLTFCENGYQALLE